MVFKPFTHLARQSFTKSLAHGYAQSVVAASQSSYASSTTSLGQFGNYPISKFTRTSQFPSVFQNASNSSGAGAKAGHASSSGTAGGDGGLAAYYAAWQHAQQTGDDSDWRQFQFAKRIDWKASPVTRESKGKHKEDGKLRSRSLPHLRGSVDRAYSANAVDDIKKAEDAVAEAESIAKIDQAIADEIDHVQKSNAASSGNETNPLATQAEATSDKASSTRSSDDYQSSAITPESSVPETSIDVKDSQQNLEVIDRSQAYFEHIEQLRLFQQFAEIPAVFEAALKEGYTPSVQAYNALLIAAIKLPVNAHQAVPKGLDVYADMLRRRVLPDQETYTILLQLLASRATEVLDTMRALEQRRARFSGLAPTGAYMFQSSEAEHAILAEDNSLALAIKLFKTATSPLNGHKFSSEVYCSLITACAKGGCVDDMIQIFAQMESHKVIPHAAMFAPMIQAFAAAGDLNSAVECYNEYKALAIADNKGVFGIIDRKDNEVYAALIKAYASCGKEEGGQRFFDKIFASYDHVTEDRQMRLESMESTVVSNAVVQHFLDAANFHEALAYLETRTLSNASRARILTKICEAAADANDTAIAIGAYESLPSDIGLSPAPVMSILAAFVRQGMFESATAYWNILISSTRVTPSFIEPATMYAVGLLKNGQVEEGLMEARKLFVRVRDSVDEATERPKIMEEVDEAIDVIGKALMNNHIIPSAHANMILIWTMVENGGLVSPVAEHAIAGLGPAGISQLSLQDLKLALQVQAGMLAEGSSVFDAAHSVRFAHLLEVALSTGMNMDASMIRLIERGLATFSGHRPDLVLKWQNYLQPVRKQPLLPARYTPAPEASPMTPSTPHEDSFDPYAYATDFRGSAIIADELESTTGRADTHLSEALAKFKNMRRVGRHPRYFTYAKLITAAAKASRMNLVHDILGMARHDVPLIPQYSIVKYGWISILDSMVAACLTLGDRALAAKYHQELLEMGAAPSANTFGLYITTMKESTKTFDEATEAVKVFHRAMSEGVEPTSFLYNALIGKLGKARRIDDCLLYFAEMRSLGIRPTSVTYGTIVNALCRVSDERFAEEMFDEMESMPNYKPRPAPYNSLIQHFLNTKRDRSKVLAYYERMQSKNIAPTMHTYKLLIDAYASLEPVDMDAAEKVLDTIKSSGQQPEAVHYASLIHAKGCVVHDMDGARKIFDSVTSNPYIRIQPCLYQALFEAMVANHQVAATGEILKDMASRNIEMTPYIANTLIHGWAAEGSIANAKSVYNGIGKANREPSTYEAMTRAFLASEDRHNASNVVQEMLSRGYPSAVAGKILELMGGGSSNGSVVA